MNGNSIISLQLHSYTLVTSFTQGAMRIMMEANHTDEVLYKSARFTSENFPSQLKVLFESVTGFYQYVYKVAAKNMADRFVFKNGQLKIRVQIEGKMRSIPIKMKKMIEDKDNAGQGAFLLTSIGQQNEEESISRVSEGWASKIDKSSGPRLKLMMMRQNNRFKKSIIKAPEFSTSSVTQNTREYPYIKPQTYHRYSKNKTEENTRYDKKSLSEGKTMYTYQRSLNLKKNMKENNIDLSNQELKMNQVKDLVSYEWAKLLSLNIGYNNIGTEGLKILTSISWPSLKTLYVCFNNIYKVEWTPSNLFFLKTLSLSGNKIKQIPKNIVQLQFLQELFIYNNRIQILPQQLSLLEQLKNFSIYGNKLDHIKNRKILIRLKSRKVQIWQ